MYLLQFKNSKALCFFENLLKTVTNNMKDINNYSDKLKHIQSESFVGNAISQI